MAAIKSVTANCECIFESFINVQFSSRPCETRTLSISISKQRFVIFPDPDVTKSYQDAAHIIGVKGTASRRVYVAAYRNLPTQIIS